MAIKRKTNKIITAYKTQERSDNTTNRVVDTGNVKEKVRQNVVNYRLKQSY